MANAKGYKALLIRQDAREAIDHAKNAYKEQTGIALNYSQFVSLMCKQFVDNLKSDLSK